MLAPEPYGQVIERSITEVAKVHNLTPIVVDDIINYDLKGRVVIAYFPMVGEDNRLLKKTYRLSGILYYSYPGDAESAIEAINEGIVLSEDGIDKSSQSLIQRSVRRLLELKIANQSTGVAYWWNLKASVGVLTSRDPYEMIADEVANELDQFLKSDET
ncbi:hypothetical protein [Thermococcus stetteri]|uniref:hypothetical protein n=1 Tax=Thermococcus stetteri TaxID=49900 RepID=UPI001AE300DC|nr:hypothetical protein [Thermococcus stetteri]MBP1912457.1 hypothetical protein [Thermococcus stetteri]